jgi:hypothetical protein
VENWPEFAHQYGNEERASLTWVLPQSNSSLYDDSWSCWEPTEEIICSLPKDTRREEGGLRSCSVLLLGRSDVKTSAMSLLR